MISLLDHVIDMIIIGPVVTLNADSIPELLRIVAVNLLPFVTISAPV